MLYAIIISDDTDRGWEDISERSGKALEATGLKPLFITNPLYPRGSEDADNPDFEVSVKSHGFELDARDAFNEISGLEGLAALFESYLRSEEVSVNGWKANELAEVAATYFGIID